MDSKYKIFNVRGHLEAYLDGKFICSADNEREMYQDLQEYETEISKS